MFARVRRWSQTARALALGGLLACLQAGGAWAEEVEGGTVFHSPPEDTTVTVVEPAAEPQPQPPIEAPSPPSSAPALEPVSDSPPASEQEPAAAPATVLGEGLRARPEQFAPAVLTVPGEALLIDPPAEPPAVLPEIPDAMPIPDQEGVASWYGLRFQGRKTASGERFDRHALTAAHPTLPFGTRVCVRSQVNGQGVVVRINDRGPHVANRIIDLSEAAAKSIGMHSGLGLKSVELFALEEGQIDCPAAEP